MSFAEKSLIFDFFLQKKIKNQILLSRPPFFGRNIYLIIMGLLHYICKCRPNRFVSNGNTVVAGFASCCLLRTDFDKIYSVGTLFDVEIAEIKIRYRPPIQEIPRFGRRNFKQRPTILNP
jgi:hypothetical protein